MLILYLFSQLFNEYTVENYLDYTLIVENVLFL